MRSVYEELNSKEQSETLGEIYPSRRRALLMLSCNAMALSLASCGAPRDAPPASQAQPFADERFPVRLVNRAQFDPAFQPARVPNLTAEKPGTIIIDTANKHLYLIESTSEALRYGIAVGAAGRSWKGQANVARKAKWPAWHPTDEMKQTAPGIPARIPPGDDNPLGARALYLYQNHRDTLYRIHGTSEPWTIGTEASSGCIRMFNEDIITLYDKVEVGTKVVVL
jgi:lipoprotein-anchoring transpeptidase ErfK/SrfK